MSKPTPEDIRGSLSGFDAHVRGAVYSGDLQVVEKKEKEIKYFYKLCMRLTNPDQVAAFNRKFFLHGFMRDYRKEKDSPTFIEDQREKLRKYDTKVWANSLMNAEKTAVVVPDPNSNADSQDKRPQSEHQSLPTNMAPISEPMQTSAHSPAGYSMSSALPAPKAPEIPTHTLHDAQRSHQDSHISTFGSKNSNNVNHAATKRMPLPVPKLAAAEISTQTLHIAQRSHQDSHMSTFGSKNSNNVNHTATKRIPLPVPKSAAVSSTNTLPPAPVTAPSSNKAISYSSSSGKKISNFVNSAASLKKNTPPVFVNATAPHMKKLPVPPVPVVSAASKIPAIDPAASSHTGKSHSTTSYMNAPTRPISYGPIKIGPPVSSQQSRYISNPDAAVAGPGPRTTAHYVGNIRRPVKDGVIRRPIDERQAIGENDLDLLDKIDEEDILWRKFQEIEEEHSDSDYHPPSDDVEETTRSGKRKRDASDNEGMSTTEEKPRTKGKGKEKQVHYEDEIDELDGEKSIHYRPRLSSQPADRSKPIPTGLYHPTKCSHCRLSGRQCEKQKSGGACVSCRRFKHKCEYSRARKEVKSKPVVESEDDGSCDGLQPTGTPEPRHPRIASAAARRAIKKVSVIERPPAKKARMKSDIQPQPLPFHTAVLDDEVMKKLDTILTHLSAMAGYLKRIVEVGEANYDMGDAIPEGNEIHSTPPQSETSPRESPALENSPLTSPSPSPRVIDDSTRHHATVDTESLTNPAAPSAVTSDIDMLPPPPPSPPRPHVIPNVNLIQPTPESSQNGFPVTQLHPTPNRVPLDSTSDVSPADIQSSPLGHIAYPVSSPPIKHVLNRSLLNSTSSITPAASPLPRLSPLSPISSESEVLPVSKNAPFVPSSTMSPTARLSPLSLPLPLTTGDTTGLVPPISVMNDHDGTDDGLPAVRIVSAVLGEVSTNDGLPAETNETAALEDSNGLPVDLSSVAICSGDVDRCPEVLTTGIQIPSDSQDQMSSAAAQLTPVSPTLFAQPGPNIVPATDGSVSSGEPLPLPTSEISSAVDQAKFSGLTIEDIISMPERMDSERNDLLNVPDPESQRPAVRTRSRSHTPNFQGPASRTRSRSRSPFQGVKRKSDATQDDDNAPNKRPK